MVVATFGYGPFLLIHAACMTGLGFWTIAGVESFIVIPMVALVMAVLSLPAFAFKRMRGGAWEVLVVAGGLVVLFVPVVRAATDLRHTGFLLAAKRAAPLVAAIEQYDREKGSPPTAFSQLVPRYLPELPRGLPPLEIVTGDDARERFFGNRWVLESIVPTGIINWDKFLYFPARNYPEVGYGGWIQRIGDWAYVHE